MPVRVCLRIAEFGCNAVLETLGYEVLQALRVIVNFIPGIPQAVVKETLQQAVMTQNFQGAHLAGGRQTDAMMLFVLHIRRLLGSQLLEHPGNRSGSDAQMPGEGVTGRAFPWRAAQLQNRFQIIVHRFGVDRQVSSRRH